MSRALSRLTTVMRLERHISGMSSARPAELRGQLIIDFRPCWVPAATEWALPGGETSPLILSGQSSISWILKLDEQFSIFIKYLIACFSARYSTEAWDSVPDCRNTTQRVEQTTQTPGSLAHNTAEDP